MRQCVPHTLTPWHASIHQPPQRPSHGITSLRPPSFKTVSWMNVSIFHNGLHPVLCCSCRKSINTAMQGRHAKECLSMPFNTMQSTVMEKGVSEIDDEAFRRELGVKCPWQAPVFEQLVPREQVVFKRLRNLWDKGPNQLMPANSGRPWRLYWDMSPN